METVAEVAPAATVACVCGMAGSLLSIPTVCPPAGAAAVSLIVPVTLLPPVTDAGETVKVDRGTPPFTTICPLLPVIEGVTVSVAVMV